MEFKISAKIGLFLCRAAGKSQFLSRLKERSGFTFFAIVATKIPFSAVKKP
ncbi:hypothetical protein [Spirosoma horti]